MNDCCCHVWGRCDPPPGTALPCKAPPPSPSLLQLCAPRVCLHPVSLGSEPSLTGKQAVASPKPLPSFSQWFHINISILSLAFLKCQKNCPKAFRPVKLNQTCKTEPLMKYINLEHWTFIHSIVLFAYKPPWEKQSERKKEREDTPDKHIIEEKSRQWLGAWNTLIQWYIL